MGEKKIVDNYDYNNNKNKQVNTTFESKDSGWKQTFWNIFNMLLLSLYQYGWVNFLYKTAPYNLQIESSIEWDGVKLQNWSIYLFLEQDFN